MITISESSTPEVIIAQSTDVLLETVVAPGSVIATAADAVDIITETVTTEIVTTADPGDTITGTEEVGFVVETPAAQGPMGPRGPSGGAAYPGKTLISSGGLLTEVRFYSDAAKTTLAERRVLAYDGGVLSIIQFFDGAGALTKTRILTYSGGVLVSVVDT